MLIVGGGFAGVSAARRLIELGYKVTLVEARDRLGGRVHSMRVPMAAAAASGAEVAVEQRDGAVVNAPPHVATVELGAAVLMGVQGGNPLGALCAKHGLRMHRLEATCPLHDVDGSLRDPALDAHVEALFNSALASAATAARGGGATQAGDVPPTDLVVGAAVQVEHTSKWYDARVVACRAVRTTRGAAAGPAEVRVHYCGWKTKYDEWIRMPSPRIQRAAGADRNLSAALRMQLVASEARLSAPARRALNWHMANLEFACAASLSSVSAAQWDQDDKYAYAGDHVVLPDGGYGALLEKLARGVDAQLGVVVTGVEMRDAGGVRAVCADGVRTADALLLTVPLGVLQRAPSEGGMQFSPPLSDAKREAIARTGFGVLNKVALFFDHAFWPHETDFFGRLLPSASQRGLFFLFFNVHHFDDRAPVLLALVAGAAARQLELLTDSDVTAHALGALRGMFGPTPEPTRVVVTRWAEDPFAYGSYSYLGVGGRGADYATLAEPVDGRLFFAGEHTSEEHPATVVGAYLSGLRAAAEIHQALG